MLKVLLKKQLSEIFRSYFYDQKKNKARSKGTVIAYMVLFVLLMAGVLGGMFTGLSLAKDNDLLLAMPIPVCTIIAARLLGVYLMGLMYAGVVLLPAIIVYLVVAQPE